jgi:hypothetical protein
VARSAKWHAELDIGSLRLAPGSHSSPREGVCVVELASLLGGEKFSDRPGCVCNVIAAFLRSFNDRVAHAERQRLVPYADRAVGSRADRQITRMRRDVCLVWAGARPDGGQFRWFLERLMMRLRIWVVVGLRQAMRLNEGAGEYAARVVFARYGTRAAFALLDHLLETGAESGRAPTAAKTNGRPLEAAPFPDAVEGATQTRVAAAIRQLAGDEEIAQHENGSKGAHHNGHAGHLGGRDAGQRHEEDVEDDYARNGDPERETKPAEDLHHPARVP